MTKLRLALGLTAGITLHWLVLILSYRPYSNNLPFASGGFPIHVFDYPLPPMGNGIPLERLDGLLYHFIFWTILTFIISFLLPKKWVTKNATIIATSLAVITTIIGIIYLLIKFD